MICTTSEMRKTPIHNEIKHAARVLSRYRDARRTRILRIRLRLTVRVKKAGRHSPLSAPACCLSAYNTAQERSFIPCNASGYNASACNASLYNVSVKSFTMLLLK